MLPRFIGLACWLAVPFVVPADKSPPLREIPCMLAAVALAFVGILLLVW